MGGFFMLTSPGQSSGRLICMTPTTGNAAPALGSERFELIDIIRGFALFGVMVANMVWITQWFALTSEDRAAMPTARVDDIVGSLSYLLIDYKFYTIFSMLFGLGFAMQLTRSAQRGQPISALYARRLAILFVLGMAHGILLWFGDILHIYAMIGFVLLNVSGCSDKTLLRWALGIAVLVGSLPFIQWCTITLGWTFEHESTDPNKKTELFLAISDGTWLDIVRLNWNAFFDAYTDRILGMDGTIYWFLSVLWKFLVGFVIGRRMLLQHAEQHLRLYRRVLPWALGIGLIGGGAVWLADAFFDVWLADESSPVSLVWIFIELSTAALSIAYICILVLLFQRPSERRWISMLAPVGQMALTNYLFQSVQLVLLFYGVGLGLMGRVGTTGCLAICFVSFVLQIVVSAWWLRYFRFGPAEWAWRCLTYGQRYPLRRRPQPKAAI